MKDIRRLLGIQEEEPDKFNIDDLQVFLGCAYIWYMLSYILFWSGYCLKINKLSLFVCIFYI